MSCWKLCRKYTGTVVFVSHDRYFIDKLATRIFEVGDGKVEMYPGNYEDYMWRKQGGAEKLQQTVASNPAITQPTNGSHAAPAESKSRRLNPLKRKQMEDRVQELEQEIAQTETTIAEYETALLNYVSAEETQRQTHELESSREELATLMAEWEALSQALQT